MRTIWESDETQQRAARRLPRLLRPAFLHMAILLKNEVDKLSDCFSSVDGFGVLADVAHEKESLVLREHGRSAYVVCRNGKFKIAFGFVPQLAIKVANENNFLVVFDHFLDASPGYGGLCIAHGLLLVENTNAAETFAAY